MKPAHLAAALTLGLTASLVLPLTASASPTTAATSASIDAYLDQVIDDSGVPGLSVVVTHDDQVVFADGYGHDSTGAKMTRDTPMRVASVSKSFTAMAVMTLVEDGRIELDGPVAEQLPGFAMDDPRAAEVTVRQLLTQTSGFSDTTIDIQDLDAATSPADYTARLTDDSLASDPGTRWEYCNVNSDVAARLVEVASGTDFADYMKREVFDPLGMTGSATRDEDVEPALGYNSLFGLWLPREEPDNFLDDSGAGGIITSAGDMGQWLISQNGFGTQLVTPEGRSAMHTASDVHAYGMGWGVEPSGRLIHSGNLMTYNAVQVLIPDTGYGFAVMTNGAGLSDVTYATMEGLVALSEGRQPSPVGDDRQLFELVMGLLGLSAIGLGVTGVLRSRRWAARRAGKSTWRIGLRMVPVLIPVVLFAGYPDLVSLISNGRTITWPSLFYFALPLTVTLLVAALAGATTTAVRIVRLRSVGSAG